MLALLQTLIVLATLVTLALAVFDMRVWLAMRRLADQPPALPPGLPAWPRLTLVVPARNEAATIGLALRSKLADDYPDLEVVVVDDRSSDGTGDIARLVADDDARVRVVRVDRLPDGWLGKVNAMARGSRAATGDWLLFSDADVHFERGTLRRAVAYAERRRFDFVAAYPELMSRGFALDATLAVLMRVLGRAAPAYRIPDPSTGTAMGSGSFNLVRREAFERTAGFEWLRMEAADDVGLGLLMKLSGSRCDLLSGRGTMHVLFYPRLRDMWRGMEKNVAVEGPRGAAKFAALVAGLASIEFAPFAALLLGRLLLAPWLGILGAVGVGATAASTALALWRGNGDLVPALVWPVGSLLFFAGMLRAGWLSFRGGGVRWRDTFYRNAELHAGMRVMSLEARRELAERVRSDARHISETHRIPSRVTFREGIR